MVNKLYIDHKALNIILSDLADEELDKSVDKIMKDTIVNGRGLSEKDFDRGDVIGEGKGRKYYGFLMSLKATYQERKNDILTRAIINNKE